MLTLGAQYHRSQIIMRISKDISWNNVQWPQVKDRVRRLQRRIYEARKSNTKKRLYFLQHLLINSTDAKLLAVLQVTSLNKGRKTPGVDKKVATTGDDKLMIVKSLSINGKAQPIRRVWIDKPGKTEKRPLGIPTIRDRAKQALAKLALEPEWEAVFEPNSFGFRPGRGAHDAIESIFHNLCHNSPKWVYDADIRKCFDTISHSALLTKINTFPIMRDQIAAWLSAGVMEDYSNTSNDISPTTMGTPQGGVISPLLANIALHGLENHLKSYVKNIPGKVLPSSNRGTDSKVRALGVVRYADDFVLTHVRLDILNECIKETKQFLSGMSLSISEEKSKLRDCRNGFQFLGFQIIQIRRKGKYVAKIYPSRNNQAKFLLKVRELIQQSKSISSYDLIERLGPVVIGWARYYQYCECSIVE